ncbi:hypothetical protein BST19_25330 [Mycobacterium bouchedurhonense]|uniref:HTH luxR-type domain-containing protein n=1 Tax=Mycobacterium bouchedurhonense TaxID=701041 RepID=A0ABX3S5Y7_MYCBC|nr:hypothetical protein BST19_25330 [Mycobacterium bouchedurhonense]
MSSLIGALDHLRRQSSAQAVFDLAAKALCESGMFARVMVSRVVGSTWSPLAQFALTNTGRAILEIDGVVEDLHIPLVSPLVEAEVVRRRLPALVTEAQDEPRTHRPLVERTGTREYVVAPIVADSVVVGLLHADRPTKTDTLSELDRDLLRLFADGVGLCIERADLNERAEHQRSILAEACAAAVGSLPTLGGVPELQLGAPPQRQGVQVAGGHERGRPEQHRESTRLARLTVREREVLALLASGATNAQLADRLTVAESTIKSHVKHILHKLGAANRAAAISCYLRDTRIDERWPR